jgi:hypothetical protein
MRLIAAIPKVVSNFGEPIEYGIEIEMIGIELTSIEWNFVFDALYDALDKVGVPSLDKFAIASEQPAYTRYMAGRGGMLQS